MTTATIDLVTGWPADRPIQCNLFGGVTPGNYNSSDILSTKVFPSRSLTSIFSPAVRWYTKNATQNGFSQGQVEPSFSAAQMALLMPGIRYTLVVYRALESAPSNPEAIARVLLTIDPIAIN